MKSRGQVLIQTVVFGSIAIFVLAALVQWSILMIRNARQTNTIELSTQIAEAGIEYYRWHLAHASADYQDGTGAAGPYIHSFKDKDGNVIGQFTLAITPPASGSTLVTIDSTGQVQGTPNITKIIEVKMAIPSLAKYAVVAEADLRFGAGTEVFGPIHSNGGIHFDGLAHNLVTSAKATYDDPDHSGGSEFGVHTHISPTDPLPPAGVPARNDVFEAGRQFPVPAVDFSGITTDLAGMKTAAQAAGRYFAGSGGLGYHVVFKTNDTFDIYRVNTLFAIPNGCSNDAGQTGWGSWSIAAGGAAQTLLGNYAIPANGIVFAEDSVWVDGQINTARVTLASARFPDNPATRTSITVNSNLLYTNYDGRDVIALIAQQDINAGMTSADTLRIDAALIAQNGRVGRYYYAPAGGGNHCSPYDSLSTITLYGIIGTSQRYGFAYTDGTGYDTRNIVYDTNLLYAPPPSFPLTTDAYTTVSWKELK